MQYAVFLVVDAFENLNTGERARVARLAAAGWIKRGAIECHGRPATDAIGLGGHARCKFDQMRIVVVETFGCGHVPVNKPTRGEAMQERTRTGKTPKTAKRGAADSSSLVAPGGSNLPTFDTTSDEHG